MARIATPPPQTHLPFDLREILKTTLRQQPSLACKQTSRPADNLPKITRLFKTGQISCRKICRSTRPRLSGTMTQTIGQIHSIKRWMKTRLSTTLGCVMQAELAVSSTRTLYCNLTLVQILMISRAFHTVFSRIMKSWPVTKHWTSILNDTFSNNTVECLRQS